MNRHVAEQKEFIIWLKDQIAGRRWSYSEFAEKSGLAASTVTEVLRDDLSRRKRAGMEFCRRTAKALRLPEAEVLEKAGWLGRDLVTMVDEDPKIRQILTRLRDFDEQQINHIHEFIQLYETWQSEK